MVEVWYREFVMWSVRNVEEKRRKNTYQRDHNVTQKTNERQSNAIM